MSDDLEARLRRLGDQPVDPRTQALHLQAMASVRIRNRSVLDKLKVAGALVAGFMLGSTGLAFAGALPAPAQDVASTTLAKVGVSVPVGTERYFGAECVAAEGGAQAKNRGQYLKQERAKGPEALAAAKASSCGKPLSSINDTGDDSAEDVADETETDETEAPKPDKCVDGVKVTGKSSGKGKSDAAAKATKACETPQSTTPGAVDDGDDASDTDKANDKANDEANDRADDADADEDDDDADDGSGRSGSSGPSDNSGSGRGSDD